MVRTEYYDDPQAPAANSLVPAATVFVQDEEARVLMVQRSDNGLWALPGGTMDIGESLGECAEREVLEETGYRVHVVDVIGVYSDPKHVIAYSDGEVRQQFAISFRALLISCEGKASDATPGTSRDSASRSTRSAWPKLCMTSPPSFRPGGHALGPSFGSPHHRRVSWAAASPAGTCPPSNHAQAWGLPVKSRRCHTDGWISLLAASARSML